MQEAMRPPRVLVIGSTGMLGTAVTLQLQRQGLEVVESSRTRGLRFDAEIDDLNLLIEASGLDQGDYVVNCVGLTKTHLKESDSAATERAVRLNVLFPISLVRVAEKFDLRIIQVATDCVFSGNQGQYVEAMAHDPLDVYGKSKSLGEIQSEKVLHLRCSLIGPELSGRNSLFFEWVRNLELGAVVDGFVNHRWNGLTSMAFGSIVSGLISSRAFYPGVQHLVPANSLSKFELVQLELELLGRDDVTLTPSERGSRVDRTLSTSFPDKNELLFRLAGFKAIPTIGEMMDALPWAELRSN